MYRNHIPLHSQVSVLILNDPRVLKMTFFCQISWGYFFTFLSETISIWTSVYCGVMKVKFPWIYMLSHILICSIFLRSSASTIHNDSNKRIKTQIKIRSSPRNTFQFKFRQPRFCTTTRSHLISLAASARFVSNDDAISCCDVLGGYFPSLVTNAGLVLSAGL